VRVLVCGSRHFNDYELLQRTLDEIRISVLIHGAARGADRMAGQYATSRGIPVEEFPADWNTYGKAAGPIRNSQMLKEGKPVLVVAFRHSASRGTQNMIDQATKAGVPVRIIDLE
jgi:hypothetical protein